MRRFALTLVLSSALLPFPAVLAVPADKNHTKAREERPKDQYRKWVEEDVAFIISDEEKATFAKLSTDEERERFIEQFWRRRDPDPSTPSNEYRDEYYRRLTYAKERFGSVRSDQGRIYITLGPPDQIESHPSGGTYFRSQYEGGGDTVAYPFEVWSYRHVPGVGENVAIEFVDKSGTGNFVMALDPEEKDALTHVPGIGLTQREQMGLTDKRDRSTLPVDGSRTQDQFFERLMLYTNLEKAPQIEYKDLRTRVQSRVLTAVLPVNLRITQLYASPDRAAVPVSVEVENRGLSFREERGVRRAEVHFYGQVTGLDGRVVTEFEDQVGTDYPADRYEAGLREKSLYQKLLLLPAGRYKLGVAVQDANSGATSVLESGFVVPPYQKDRVLVSGMILARQVAPVTGSAPPRDPFILGEYRVVPNVAGVYNSTETMGVYCQAYNLSLDPRSMEPSLTVRFRIMRNGNVIQETEDLRGDCVQRSTRDRAVIVKGIPLRGIPAGSYTLAIQVEDRITKTTATASTHFEVKQ